MIAFWWAAAHRCAAEHNTALYVPVLYEQDQQACVEVTHSGLRHPPIWHAQCDQDLLLSLW